MKKRYFSPKIRVFSKKRKKKGLHFDFISDFPISLPKSGCSLKKKDPQSESFSEETSATDSKLYVLFSMGDCLIRLTQYPPLLKRLSSRGMLSRRP